MRVPYESAVAGRDGIGWLGWIGEAEDDADASRQARDVALLTTGAIGLHQFEPTTVVAAPDTGDAGAERDLWIISRDFVEAARAKAASEPEAASETRMHAYVAMRSISELTALREASKGKTGRITITVEAFEIDAGGLASVVICDRADQSANIVGEMVDIPPMALRTLRLVALTRGALRGPKRRKDEMKAFHGVDIGSRGSATLAAARYATMCDKRGNREGHLRRSLGHLGASALAEDVIREFA